MSIRSWRTFVLCTAGKMVTLTKFLVIVTFTVVFVLGSAFISVEKQKDDEELEDIDNSFLRENKADLKMDQFFKKKSHKSY